MASGAGQYQRRNAISFSFTAVIVSGATSDAELLL
jgi:hypothetical protein